MIQLRKVFGMKVMHDVVAKSVKKVFRRHVLSLVEVSLKPRRQASHVLKNKINSSGRVI